VLVFARFVYYFCILLFSGQTHLRRFILMKKILSLIKRQPEKTRKTRKQLSHLDIPSGFN